MITNAVRRRLLLPTRHIATDLYNHILIQHFTDTGRHCGYRSSVFDSDSAEGRPEARWSRQGRLHRYRDT